MADYAIHDTTLLAQANILRKKFGTNDRQDPADYADKMDLMGPLEEKTVSGSVVAFSDGADDVPLKSCAVTIAPTLDGVSSVDVVKAGKNLAPVNDFTAQRQTVMTFDTPLPAGIYSYSYLATRTGSDSRNGGFRFVYTDDTYLNEYLYVDTETRRVRDGVVFAKPVKSIYVYSISGSYADSGNFTVTVDDFQIEVGSTATAYEPYVAPTTHTANLGRTIYGGEVDVVNGTGTDENGNDFTFTPVPILSRLGDNTMWGDGDLSVVYRSSGTQTIITPTLISKTVTANGTYTASDEGADGYSEVTVNVSGGGGNTPEASATLICDNSAYASALTFTDDYTNYDLLKIVTYRADAGTELVFYMTPAMLDAMWQYSSNIANFNQPFTNSYVAYQKTTNTAWTRYGNRNMNIKYVYGLVFTNCTCTETELYNRRGNGSSEVTFTPPTGKTFYDFDYILFSTSTGANDETEPSLEVFQPNQEKDIFGSDNIREESVIVNKYNSGGKTVTVGENTITAHSYFFVAGIELSF